jgi:hypothetical protein
MLRNLYQDIAAIHFHREFGQMQALIQIAAAGDAIVFPCMPGADQSGSMQRAMAERSPGMRADAGERVNFSAGVTDRHGFLSDFHLHH